MSHDAGKGDTYRPYNQAAYGENYDRIFRRTDRGPESEVPESVVEHLDNVQETNDQAPIEQADETICPVCGYPTCIHGRCTISDDCPECEAAHRHDDEAPGGV